MPYYDTSFYADHKRVELLPIPLPGWPAGSLQLWQFFYQTSFAVALDFPFRATYLAD
jgi:hypothetical protein